MSRVPKVVLEEFYKIELPSRKSTKYTANTLLSMIALKKGWITGSSNPHCAQAARVILEDYTTGKMVFCHLRPDFNNTQHEVIL